VAVAVSARASLEIASLRVRTDRKLDVALTTPNLNRGAVTVEREHCVRTLILTIGTLGVVGTVGNVVVSHLTSPFKYLT
jgi:hypothetical protein